MNQRIVESSRVEFKSSYNPAAVIRTICAFANDIDNMGGGYIIIGVEEENGHPKFPIKGIEKDKIDSILKKLREHCHFIEPLYEPVVEPILYKDVYVIVIWSKGGYGRPYKAPKDVLSKDSRGQKQYFIRKFASTTVASLEEQKELFYVSSNIPFDDRENLAADVSDLDIALMRSHLKEINSTLYQYSLTKDALSLAQDMQLVSGPTEHIKPLNVGILMFSERPEKYFRYAFIEVVDIPDPTGNNMVEKLFTGPIQRQLKDALAYIKNYAIKEVVLKDKNKAEARRIYNYPFAAIEEILANAIYHRSYQIQKPIVVRITENSIEVTSFPGFDRSISDEKIASYDIRAKLYRNRRIGDFLKELHLIGLRNTGFPNALNALKQNGSERFSIEMNPERDYVSVTIPVHPYFLKGKNIKEQKQQAYLESILSQFSDVSMSITDLARSMGYKGITNKLKNAVEQLCITKKLEVVTSNRDVKYKANRNNA